MPHTLCLFGVTPAGKRETAGVIKQLPDQCRLMYDAVMPHEPAEGWEGPLLEAPDGVYELLQESHWLTLIVFYDRILLDGQLVLLKQMATGGLMLDMNTLEAFRALLRHSEKKIHVYEEPGTGVRQYLFLWETDETPQSHPQAPSCAYLGQADLQTGRISTASAKQA